MSESPVIVKTKRRKEEHKDDGVTTVARALAPQMGSSPKYLGQQEIDRRVFAVFSEPSQAAMGHFFYRAKVDKVRYFDYMVEWELATTPSIGGLGRRQVIQTIAAAAGVAKGVMDTARKPNILARNITKRDWREKAEAEGRTVED